MHGLAQEIERIFSSKEERFDEQTYDLFNQFKARLNSGEVRAAEKVDGRWQVNHWVKKGVLLGFRLGKLVDCSINEQFRYFDKNTYPLKQITLADKVRQVPGGSAIRDGAFVAQGVVIMPPAYINVGAYVDSETMIDSHALVGSCAQIGKRGHLSAGSQIGGVLEPIGALPVIIEDNVTIGGNCGIYDGTIICENTVIGAGTILTGSTPVYDLIKHEVYRKTENYPLVIPPGAVVVAGSRAVNDPFAREHQISMYTPIIVKYRDEKTSRATALEEALR